MTDATERLRALAALHTELNRAAYRLHHHERSHLEFGVPVNRDTPIAQDPAGATLTELVQTCTALRAQIAVLDRGEPNG